MSQNFSSVYAQFGQDSWKNAWLLLCSLLLLVGIFVSPALMSIGMISTAGLLFMPNAWSTIQSNFKSQPLYYLYMGIFFMYLVSGLYSENLDYWSEKLQLKLPYLLLPLSLSSLNIQRKTIHYFMATFFVFTLLGAVGSLINFALNYEAILKSYLHAKTMPTPFDIGHIRFSLMSAFSIFIGYYLIQENFLASIKNNKWYLGIGTFILFVFIHVLSVRSGILAFYAGAFVYVVFEGSKIWGVKKMLLSLLVLLCIPVVMYLLSPTLRNKLTYMVKDVSQFTSGRNVNNYSDGNRLLSWTLAWRIGNENPTIGVGVGDIADKMNHIYETEFPYSEYVKKDGTLGWHGIAPNNRLIPHSQFMYIFAGCGFIGLLWFVVLNIWPYFQAQARSFWLLMVYHTIMLTSFISEATLEIQLGVALHAYVIIFLISSTQSLYKQNQ
jgi:O-antigen ligase